MRNNYNITEGMIHALKCIRSIGESANKTKYSEDKVINPYIKEVKTR